MNALRSALLLLLGIALAVPATAQTITVRDGNETILNDSTIIVPATGNEVELKYTFTTLFTGMGTEPVRLRRWEEDVPAGTENYFCWSQCYNARMAGDSAQWTDSYPVNMEPRCRYRKLAAYHRPNGQTGAAVYRYKLWSPANPSDSATFTIIFDVPLGIFGPAAPKPTGEVSIAPNPANEWVRFNYKGNANGSNRELLVFDLLGNQVAREPLAATSGNIVLNTQEYAPGIYVMSLRETGQLIATKKLVIDR